jgi:hypothetical protein
MAKTSKGHIQQLPSGSFRVKVYAGIDPVTGKERLLRQTCPDEAAAHAALSRMLVEADGGRFPDQHPTLGQALGKYLEVADLEVSTREAHVRYEWAERNVARNARPPHPRKREPDPPTPELAARLLNLVWTEDEEFGLYLWTAITTGALRGRQ